MLVAHNIIDCLRGDPRHPFCELPGVRKIHREEMATLIERAEKFDFGDLVLEPHPEGRPGHWTVPMLTPDEIGFFRDGYLVLPAPICWFEWTLGNSRSGILIRALSDVQWGFQRLDWTPHDHLLNSSETNARFRSNVLFEAIETTVDRTRCTEREMKVEVQGNVGLYETWLRSGEGIQRVVQQNISTAPMLALYMILMLNSKTTEVRAESAPEKLNKKRMRAGRSPLAAHRIVTIVPERFRAARDPNAPKGTHRPPRLHWRRSHMRHYDHHVPSARWMPEVVHEGRKGWWVALIARMLVGRADLGEVSHEYRIAGQDVQNDLTSAPSGQGTALTENRR